MKVSETGKFLTKQQIVDTFKKIMNEAIIADPVAISALCEHRVECNDILADHPTIQVYQENPHNPEDIPVVGMIGILNGICEALTGKQIAGEFDENSGLIRFIDREDF